MRGVFIAAAVALAFSILLTPYLIRIFSRQGFGQEIRAEGPQSHQAKRGTPTMGGVAILLAIWLGYGSAHLMSGEPLTAAKDAALRFARHLGPADRLSIVEPGPASLTEGVSQLHCILLGLFNTEGTKDTKEKT